MIVPLAVPILQLLEHAAECAVLRCAPIGMEDLLAALCANPRLGPRLSAALAASHQWVPLDENVPEVELALYACNQHVAFDREGQRAFLNGAKAVLLGPYEPRHLAEAIGASAELHPERFTRFGFEARAWRQALRVRTEDH